MFFFHAVTNRRLNAIVNLVYPLPRSNPRHWKLGEQVPDWREAAADPGRHRLRGEDGPVREPGQQQPLPP